MTQTANTSVSDQSFAIAEDALMNSVRLLSTRGDVDVDRALAALPDRLPQEGVGDRAVLDALAPLVLGGARALDAPLSFDHMDPPTPWLTWAMTLWNARLNQNLLHPSAAPVARAVEARVVDWLAPLYGMNGGHMVPGSTVANLTAIWAARDLRGVVDVAAPDTAHVSIEKSAKLLGLRFRPLPTDQRGRLCREGVHGLERSCLVLVAGATSTGVIDPLDLIGRAAWTHVDAAWAGPLRLSERYGAMLDGIEAADSVAISAHKWLFQPKESALVLFKEAAQAHEVLSFGGAYLAVPNIGVLGSHGAVAVPLLALLQAWGRKGFAERIDRCMAAAARFAAFVDDDDRLELLAPPETGVVVWRPKTDNSQSLLRRLPSGLASTTRLNGCQWLRCVAANPNVDINAVVDAVRQALEEVERSTA